MFSQSDLTMLMEATQSPHVCLYLPNHGRGVENRQDLILLKNLIAEARQILATAGLNPREVEASLEPAVTPIEDHDFWQHQDISPSVFLGGDQKHILSRYELVGPSDVNVEYSVGARLELRLKPPGAYEGRFDRHVLLQACRALHGVAE